MTEAQIPTFIPDFPINDYTLGLPYFTQDPDEDGIIYFTKDTDQEPITELTEEQMVLPYSTPDKEADEDIPTFTPDKQSMDQMKYEIVNAINNGDYKTLEQNPEKYQIPEIDSFTREKLRNRMKSNPTKDEIQRICAVLTGIMAAIKPSYVSREAAAA